MRCARVEQQPLMRRFGITMPFIGVRQATAVLPVRDDIFIPEGFVQGGIVTMLADFAGEFAAMAATGNAHVPAESLYTLFMRPCVLGDRELRALANVRNVSRRQVRVTITVSSAQGKEKARVIAVYVRRRATESTRHRAR